MDLDQNKTFVHLHFTHERDGLRHQGSGFHERQAKGSYELLETSPLEYLELLDSQAKRPIGNITAARGPGETPALTTEYSYSESSWDEYHGKWICSVSELNAPAKSGARTTEKTRTRPKGQG